MSLPDHRGVWGRRVPTQILESAWAVLLLVAALTLWRWMPFPGALFLVVAAAYGSGRLLLISTTDRSDGDGVAIYYAFSLLLVACSLAVLVARWPT
jgi:prolipoprotein diacylglyceryltransferase